MVDDCNVEVQQKGISAVIKITHQPKAVAVPVVTDNQNITRKKQSKLSGSKDSKKRTKKEKPFYKRVWVRVLAAILALGSCGNETDTAISDETTNPTTSITQTETALETELSFTTEYNLPETSVAEITTIPTTEEYIVPTTIPTVPITEESTVPYMAPVVEDNEEKDMVWIPNSGKRYHSNSSCSNMDNPSHVTKQTAINRGFTPCKHCYG